MRRRRWMVVGLMLPWILPAAAQTAPGRVTLFQELDQSMEALLNEGWTITDIAGNLGGVSYLLQKNNKWVTCQVITRREDSRSRCMALN
jgi:hypothetical protein